MNTRHQLILDRLEQVGACTYQELTDFFNVSSVTIRRDVDKLANENKLIKALGGVQKINSPQFLYETSLSSRLSSNQAQKRAIVELAVTLIKPGHTLYIDGGTTCIALAKLIASKCREITVVSNSPLVCLELSQNTNITVIGIGGQCDPTTMCFIGDDTEEASRKYYVDIAFISTKGLIPGEGSFESVLGTSRIKKIVAEKCKELILLIDNSKLGQRALCKVLDYSQINTIITDTGTSKNDLDLLAKGGSKVLVAVSSEDAKKTIKFA